MDMRKHLTPTIILFVLSLLPFYWLRGGLFVAAAESGLYLYHSSRSFHQCLSLWWDKISLGFPMAKNLPSIPFHGAMALLDQAGISLHLKQIILYGAILFCSGVSMYFLVWIAVENTFKHRRIIALFSAFFYLFNSFVMINFWHRFTTFLWMIPFPPLILAIYIYGLKRRNNKAVYLLGGIFFLFSFTFSSPPSAASIFFAPFIYLIFFLFDNRTNRPSIYFALKYSFYSFLSFLLVNIWWLLPYFKGAQQMYAQTGTQENNLMTLHSLSNFQGLEYSLRLLRADSMEIWGNTFPVGFIISTTLIPLIVFLPLLIQRNKSIIFFSLLNLLGLFFMKGTNGIFGKTFEMMFLHIPFFGIFRNPFEKLGIVTMLGFSVLFGVGLVTIYDKIIHPLGTVKAKLITSLLFCLICIVAVWPMWTGSILKFKIWDRSTVVEIPDGYINSDHWLVKQKEDFRIISYPITNYDGVACSWKDGYCGDNLEFLLLGDKPFIGRAITGSHSENFEKISQMLPAITYRENALKKIAPLLNVKYLLLHNDLAKNYIETLGLDTPERIRQGINSYQKDFTLERKFGELEFYKIEENYFLPHIWAINGN